jgi:hypothetical protein
MLNIICYNIGLPPKTARASGSIVSIAHHFYSLSQIDCQVINNNINYFSKIGMRLSFQHPHFQFTALYAYYNISVVSQAGPYILLLEDISPLQSQMAYLGLNRMKR